MAVSFDMHQSVATLRAVTVFNIEAVQLFILFTDGGKTLVALSHKFIYPHRVFLRVLCLSNPPTL